MTLGKLGIVDPSSFSNPNEIAVKSIALFLEVNFSSCTLKGRAELKCDRKCDKVSNLVLDAKDLKIQSIVLVESEASLKYLVSDPYSTFGSALEIQIPKDFKAASFTVKISYETSPTASGLQWLTPEQTLGKKEPYMFSQFQAIHARSVVPCQDTPSVKITYTAEITAPQQLTVLMSGLHVDQPKLTSDGKHRLSKFRQPVPIPSYLIAFAVGRISSKELGTRCSVWAEPEALEDSANEFKETEKMLDAAIQLGGDYVWGVYDLLIMPPSFPFGGMENPNITFVTPTVLAGDRSLVDVVAHEISHSWSGNLVTTATFEHFWLNEGFTMFMERKIHGIMHGEKTRQFHAAQGLEALKDAVNTLGETSQLTKLVPNLTDLDPDDAFSTIPYEKGHTFLYYLEELLGGADTFNPFLKSYFNNFKNQSIKTEDFKKYLLNFFKDRPELKKVDWDGWLYSTGMPLVVPQYDPSLTEVCLHLCQEWVKGSEGRSSDDISTMSSVQISLFLGKLLEEKPLSAQAVRRMEELYKLNASKNSEIKFRWIRLGLRAHAEEFIKKAIDFVNEQGRMKFVRPLYRELYDWEQSRNVAIENYHKNKANMMFVLSNQLLKDLHIS